MQYLLGLIVEGLFWTTGAGFKKIAGRRPSKTGNPEKWLGFLFYAAIIAAIIYFRNFF